MLNALQAILPKGWKRGVLAMACAFGTQLSSAEGATFGVTPSAISNTYGGVLTLQIGGLTNGEQVQIQQFLDLNSNGVVDASEPLINAFKTKDNSAFTINGITNINVPYDRDATTGAITTTFALNAPLDRVVGQHIIRLVSPFGNFSPQ